MLKLLDHGVCWTAKVGPLIDAGMLATWCRGLAWQQTAKCWMKSMLLRYHSGLTQTCPGTCRTNGTKSLFTAMCVTAWWMTAAVLVHIAQSWSWHLHLVAQWCYSMCDRKVQPSLCWLFGKLQVLCVRISYIYCIQIAQGIYEVIHTSHSMKICQCFY